MEASLTHPQVCGGKQDGAYNLPLHVLALFIVLIQSILCTSHSFWREKVDADAR